MRFARHTCRSRHTLLAIKGETLVRLAVCSFFLASLFDRIDICSLD